MNTNEMIELKPVYLDGLYRCGTRYLREEEKVDLIRKFGTDTEKTLGFSGLEPEGPAGLAFVAAGEYFRLQDAERAGVSDPKWMAAAESCLIALQKRVADQTELTSVEEMLHPGQFYDV